jgi:hypothetical protein
MIPNHHGFLGHSRTQPRCLPHEGGKHGSDVGGVEGRRRDTIGHYRRGVIPSTLPAVATAPQGILLRRDDDPDQAASLTNVHDGLLNLGSAPSAIAAAEDFLWKRSPGSQGTASGGGCFVS